MTDNLKRLLPMVAVICVCIWAVCVVALGISKASLPADSLQNRSSAEQSLAELAELRPASPDDPAFRRALDEMLAQPLIATVWLLTPDGRVLVSRGATAMSTPQGSTVAELATDDARQLIDVVPARALTGEQKTWLLAASALRREGDHNDIYSHLLRPITGVDGSVVALAGIAYRHSDWTPGLGWMSGVFLAGLSLLVYWLSLPLWVLLDARERGERAAAWSIFVLFGNLIALTTYLLARVPPRLAGVQEDSPA
jgi:hypothetical protein